MIPYVQGLCLHDRTVGRSVESLPVASMEPDGRTDPWTQTVALLAGKPLAYGRCTDSTGVACGEQRSVPDGATAAPYSCAYAIKGVEWRDRSAVVIRWHDSLSGCYGAQVWKRTTAKRRGWCALSGEEISRGDRIYRPWFRGESVPGNSQVQVLVAQLLSFAGIDR